MEGEFGTRAGHSVVVTEDGFEPLTGFPRELTVPYTEERHALAHQKKARVGVPGPSGTPSR